MAKCKVCGSRVPEGTEKCPMCGAKIQSNIEQSKPQIVTSSVTPEVTDGKCKVCGWLRIFFGICCRGGKLPTIDSERPVFHESHFF